MKKTKEQRLEARAEKYKRLYQDVADDISGVIEDRDKEKRRADAYHKWITDTFNWKVDWLEKGRTVCPKWMLKDIKDLLVRVEK